MTEIITLTLDYSFCFTNKSLTWLNYGLKVSSWCHLLDKHIVTAEMNGDLMGHDDDRMAAEAKINSIFHQEVIHWNDIFTQQFHNH